MAKWNLIPSAEGPFSGLDAMARYCFGLLYDRFKLSRKSVDVYSSEKFLGARLVKLADLNPRKFAGDDRLKKTYDVYCVFKQKDLAAAMGCTERTVRRCIDTLRESGVIAPDSTARIGFTFPARFRIILTPKMRLCPLTGNNFRTGKIFRCVLFSPDRKNIPMRPEKFSGRLGKIFRL